MALGATALAAWPLGLRAQGRPGPLLGLLGAVSPPQMQDQLVALHAGLRETGFVEGENLVIAYRWAENRFDRLPALAAELVRLQPAVIAATGGPVSAVAAKSATATIPIVFTAVADPVASGLVASLNRPGANVTGTAGLTAELDAKRLELLHQLAPAGGTIGVLLNPTRPNIVAEQKEVEAAARTLGRNLLVLKAGIQSEIEPAFVLAARERVGAMLVAADPLFNGFRTEIVVLAARQAFPAIYQWRAFVAEGGLMSFGPDLSEAYKIAGVYVGRILRGASPAELPVVQPTKFELAVNMKTARALGIAIPQSILARADTVIE